MRILKYSFWGLALALCVLLTVALVVGCSGGQPTEQPTPTSGGGQPTAAAHAHQRQRAAH